MTTQEKKEVAKKQNTSVAAPVIDLALVAQDAGQGLAKMDSESLAIPFIKILSSMSPQIKKSKSEYIEGAEEGMIYNTVTQQVLDGSKGVRVVPCYFEPVYLEWSDRGTGSAAPQVHAIDSDIMNQTTKDGEGKMRLQNGNYVERTHNHYCLLLDEEGVAQQVLLSMKVSQLSKSRKWNSLVASAKVKNGDTVINPPSWYYSYNLSTKPEQNDKGDWYGWNIARDQVVTAEIYHEAKTFHDSIKKGSVNVNYEQGAETAGSDRADTDNPF